MPLSKVGAKAKTPRAGAIVNAYVCAELTCLSSVLPKSPQAPSRPRISSFLHTLYKLSWKHFPHLPIKRSLSAMMVPFQRMNICIRLIVPGRDTFGYIFPHWT